MYTSKAMLLLTFLVQIVENKNIVRVVRLKNVGTIMRAGCSKGRAAVVYGLHCSTPAVNTVRRTLQCTMKPRFSTLYSIGGKFNLSYRAY